MNATLLNPIDSRAQCTVNPITKPMLAGIPVVKRVGFATDGLNQFPKPGEHLPLSKNQTSPVSNQHSSRCNRAAHSGNVINQEHRQSKPTFETLKPMFCKKLR
jgi:hypothetical protein